MAYFNRLPRGLLYHYKKVLLHDRIQEGRLREYWDLFCQLSKLHIFYTNKVGNNKKVSLFLVLEREKLNIGLKLSLVSLM